MLRVFILCLSLILPGIAAAEEAAPSNPHVVIQTSEGDITVKLFADKSPITVANFLAYVDSGFYSGTVFHRVIPNFMIQGGGFDPDMKQKGTSDPIVNESKNRLHNTRGTLAMARTNDPNSATSQFFINHRSNLNLDWAPGREGYAVFGEVVEGMDVVDFIALTPTGRAGGMGDVPQQAIVIKEVLRQP